MSNQLINTILEVDDVKALQVDFSQLKKIPRSDAESKQIIIYYKDEDNCVYIAGRGKAYEKALYWFIHKAMPFNMEVHFFPDKDVPDKFITNISNKYNMFGYKYYLHRNTYKNEKDFGVPEWNINDFHYAI